MKPVLPCNGPVRITRRDILQAGGIGLLGLSLPGVLRSADGFAGTGRSPRADSCILIFLNGGPSHLDMWDLKPDAPQEIRGEFKPIATSVSGILLSEHLPRLAKQMHHCALVRSLRHTANSSHALAVYTGMTGHDRGDTDNNVGAGADDYPCIGSMMTLQRPPGRPVVPFVTMPYITTEGKGGPPQPGYFAGWLGRNYDPFFMLRDPNAANFGLPELTPTPEVPVGRLGARRNLLGALNGSNEHHPNRRLQDMESFQARAFDLITSPAARRAFQLHREPAPVREAYGRNIYGQSVLLVRRLIEAGTRVACVSWAPDANATWDTHGNNFNKLKNQLLPQMDAAVASLLNDLAARGLLARTVVAVMGEFGRSPKVNKDAGRDHWNYCYSLLLAGGGIKGGTVYGSSDKVGGQPNTNPTGPADVIATIYHCLGIPHDLELHDRFHRPFVLVPWGNPIQELLV